VYVWVCVCVCVCVYVSKCICKLRVEWFWGWKIIHLQQLLRWKKRKAKEKPKRASPRWMVEINVSSGASHPSLFCVLHPQFLSQQKSEEIRPNWIGKVMKKDEEK